MSQVSELNGGMAFVRDCNSAQSYVIVESDFAGRAHSTSVSVFSVTIFYADNMLGFDAYSA